MRRALLTALEDFLLRIAAGCGGPGLPACFHAACSCLDFFIASMTEQGNVVALLDLGQDMCTSEAWRVAAFASSVEICAAV